MTASAAFAYADARIRARHASRPDERLWSELDASRSLGHYLQRARATVLERWTRPIDADATVHDIERTLRALFRDYALEVAEWAPERWRPSIRWVARLVDVPLTETEALPAWADPELTQAKRELSPPSGLRPSAPRTRFARFERESRALGPPDDEQQKPLDVWVSRFRELWPALMPSRRDALEAIVSRLAAHRSALAEAEKSGADLDVSRSRKELAHDLHRLLRQHPEQPAAVFVHLALVALDLERLRSALVGRALFADGSERPWV